jgi:hypothetical protein
MRLSDYFTLAEMTVTSTGLPNVPNAEELLHLKRLAGEMDKLRRQVGPIRITSGFRSAAVNSHPSVGGSSTSAHRKGLACDFVAMKLARVYVWDMLLEMIEQGLIEVDQVIIYEDRPHIHLGLTCGRARKQILVHTDGGDYVSWSSYSGRLKS